MTLLINLMWSYFYFAELSKSSNYHVLVDINCKAEDEVIARIESKEIDGSSLPCF